MEWSSSDASAMSDRNTFSAISFVNDEMTIPPAVNQSQSQFMHQIGAEHSSVNDSRC
jgi:hypothetical protein